MIKFKDKEQVVFLDGHCRCEGCFGEFYCHVALTTCQIIIVETTDKHGRNDIYSIKLNDILKDGHRLALKNGNTDKTLFTENIMEIRHKGGENRIIFREIDRNRQYINAIEAILGV